MGHPGPQRKAQTGSTSRPPRSRPVEPPPGPLPAPRLPGGPMDRPTTRVAVVTSARAVGWSAAQAPLFVGSVLGLLSLFVTLGGGV